ncbi:NAD-dependent epimerase/dehydratase family protein [uncultured Deinococcus sp.]|uniref:NAD-dependent epimerase/dehydratase family protein n=1 Tax=uncultured Deinococcus sp. TaxID=158789 RepID=UPI0025EF3DEC|nr:NAD-dependent epimerase/dehydratase family protein [uncultured Deinococcus sp.]
MKRALVTGGAGFIGSHVVDALLGRGWHVEAIDSFDPFYDPAIKHRNIAAHREHPHYTLHTVDIRDHHALRALPGDFSAIVHLAARAGVRPSIADPTTYQDVNVGGTQHLLEFARERHVPQFVFASSSSVYGVNPRVPWSEEDHVLAPISPYASTKVSGELLGHVYSHLYGLRFVALRFFTVYGERQRPDLAVHTFARRMLAGQSIPFYGDGSTRRDYTHVSDIVQGILAALHYAGSPYEVINLGNNRTISLAEMVGTLEDVLGLPARREVLPAQPGDVPQTWAHLGKAERLLDFRPHVEFHDGCATFVDWLRRQPQPVTQAKR